MSAIIYNKAFELELSHDFYDVANKFNMLRYFDIVPSATTSELMKRGRMKFVRTPKGLTVLYQAYLDTAPAIPVIRPLVELTGVLEFTFLFRIKEAQNFVQNVSDFNLYSGLTVTKAYGAGMKYLLDGTPTNLTLDPSLIDQARPKIFTYTFRGREIVFPFNTYSGLVDITVKDEQLNTVFTFSNVASDPATGVYTLPLDFTNESNGIYFIEAVKDGTSDVVNKAEIYVDNTLSREEFFSIVRLKYSNASALYNGTETYSYSIPNRKVRWRYFISVKEVDPTTFWNTEHLELDDTLAAYTFASTPAAPVGKPHPTFEVNGMETVVFTSITGGPFTDGRIPFTESAIRSFRLRQLGTVTKTLIDGLPNGATTGTDSNSLNSPTADVPPYAEIFLTFDKLTNSL